MTSDNTEDTGSFRSTNSLTRHFSLCQATRSLNIVIVTVAYPSLMRGSSATSADQAHFLLRHFQGQAHALNVTHYQKETKTTITKRHQLCYTPTKTEFPMYSLCVHLFPLAFLQMQNITYIPLPMSTQRCTTTRVSSGIPGQKNRKIGISSVKK